jgi:hypothetical protein
MGGLALCRPDLGRRLGNQFGFTAVAVLIASLAAAPASAQVGDDIPRAPYYLAVQTFYAGDYMDAERGLRRETRRGIRTVQARWIDSICYHAMLGEVLYHQGRNAEALAEFDQACQILLAYPDWLLQVKFLQPPRPDLARARRVPPWGRSERQFTLGQFADTEQIFMGELDPRRVLQEGGVFRSPMYWRVNAVEVIRTSALAIRRRSELLGPLAVHDRLSKELSDVFARGDLSPPNHWSSVWIDLLRGLAQAGVGKLDEADMLLSRAAVVEGQFDHPLTCVVLLEQGRIAMLRGDSQRAAQLLAEAGYSAYYYENWDALTESIWLGWINHMAIGGATVYPPLEPVADWTQLNRMQHVAAKLRLALAESLLWLGQPEPAAAALELAARRMGEMRGGLTSIHLLYLQANLQLMRGQFAPAGESLNQAVAAQAAASLRNFQIGRTNEMYDARGISARIAADLYASLLRDPRPVDWAYQPLDTMALLKTSHDAAFDRWFFAALERKDLPQALEVAERAKRRRFLAALPLGGRLLALRTILEAPEGTLSRAALLERQQFLVSFPAYRELAEAGAAMEQALRASSIVAQDPDDTKPLAAQFDAWAANAAERQRLLMQLAPRRLPSSIEFPPLRTTAELQKSLDEGEALVEFHAVGEDLHGFLVTRTGVHAWVVGDVRRLRSGIGEFLRALGNYGGNRTLSADDLTNDRWQSAAGTAYEAIFAHARLDLAKTTGLIIVPDDALWYLPFDALIPADVNPKTVLADHVPVRYGPTAALAIRRPQALRRPQHTGIVANRVSVGKDNAEAQTMVDQLLKVQPGAVRLPDPLPEPPHLLTALLDRFVAVDEVDPERMTLASPLPLPRFRGSSDDAGASWVALPYGGPERIVITGLSTAAEQGLKTSRRNAARDVRPGSEIFQSLCAMMAGGARTILLSRWRSGGRTNLDLVREFTQELSQSPAVEAWSRARLLAREAPLDAENEPRLRGLEQEGELATANHPFFWAGYLLVDTGPPADAVDEDGEAKPESEATSETKAAQTPPPVPPQSDDAPPAAETAPAESPTSKTPN